MIGFKLWKLRLERRKSQKEYSKYVAEAKDAENEDFRICEAIEEREKIRDKILSLKSIQLSDMAEDLGIPVPPASDKESWEEGYNPGTVRLTVNAQLQLKQAIRNEQRERWSVAVFVLKEIVAPLIAIIGAIMGLLSLIHAIRSK
jgi:hypothetical protein